MKIKTNAAEVRKEIAPLYCRYPGQLRAQPAHLEINPQEGTVTAEWNGEIGNAVPMSVWHRQELRITINETIRGEYVADLLEDEDNVRLFERIIAGHRVEWNGSNHVGHLEEDAAQAREDLLEVLEAYDYPDEVTHCPVWEPGAWLDDLTNEEMGITAESTDEELQAIADIWENNAKAEQIHLDGEVLDELKFRRVNLQQEEAESHA